MKVLSIKVFIIEQRIKVSASSTRLHAASSLIVNSFESKGVKLVRKRSVTARVLAHYADSVDIFII